MIEDTLEAFVCDEAEKDGWLTRKLKWIGRRNAPDRFFAKDGRVVLIEFKRPNGGDRGKQAKEIAELQAAGVEVHLVDGIFEALRILGVPYDLG